MIDSRCFRWATSLLLLTGASLYGQSAPANDVPLKNWATPLYWQPNQAERENAVKSGAQIQFSPSATSNTALIFVAVSPCRLVDTRGASAGFIGSTPFNGPFIHAQQTVAFPIQSSTEAATTAPTPCGSIPPIAVAYSVNLTLVPHPLGTPVNYVTLWPDNGSTIPSVSTVNDQQGAVVANSAIVPAGTNSGGIKVFAYGATDVIIDMNGFYAAPTDGGANTAIGAGTFLSDTTGVYNTASGLSALAHNTTGSYNSATGSNALVTNTTGGGNTATGNEALFYNVNGNFNTATGEDAMYANTSGNYNTATGTSSLTNNTSGASNTAVGYAAMNSNTTGSNNIAIGANAAQGAPAGNSNSIYIGSQGFYYDASVIRLGAEGVQSATFIGGIYGATGGGSAVYVNNVGQLSTTPSSRRFKEQITDMGDASSKLFQLRPVNFFYKPEYDDGSHLMQYGLIAEEVEKIYPEMVDYDKDGQVHTVKYQLLAPMLLNEVQKQNADLKTQVQLQQQENRKLEEGNRKLEERLTALEALLAGQAPVAAKAGGQ